MNTIAIATLAFFAAVFLLFQIRVIRRLLLLKRKFDQFPGAGVLAFAEVLELCCLGGACCCELSEADSKDSVLSDRDIEKARLDALVDKKIEMQKSKATEMQKEPEFLTPTEEKERVLDLITNKQKTSLQWISAVTMIPLDRVIDIINGESDCVIEEDAVIYSRTTSKEALQLREKEIDSKEITEKIKQNICPICNNSIEPNWEFCANCGYILK